MAGVLALAFTAATADVSGPNYSLQPHQETAERVAAHVDCEQLRSVYEFSPELTRSPEDWQFRRDLWRALRILDCDA